MIAPRTLNSLKVGDKITVIRSWGFSNFIYEFRTIARITKTSITDSTGIRWTMRGDQWGVPPTSRSATAAPYESEHEDRAATATAERELTLMRNRCRDYHWKNAPREIVEAVCKLLPPPPPKATITGDATP